MFQVVDRVVSDKPKRRALHAVIRDCIEFRNRRLRDSCKMDVIFANIDELKSVIRKGGWWTDKEFQLLDEIFTISGHLGQQQPSSPQVSSTVYSAHSPQTMHSVYSPETPETVHSANSSTPAYSATSREELTINAEGFKTIVINMGNGKRVVFHV
jgi:hypothetical protein